MEISFAHGVAVYVDHKFVRTELRPSKWHNLTLGGIVWIGGRDRFRQEHDASLRTHGSYLKGCLAEVYINQVLPYIATSSWPNCSPFLFDPLSCRKYCCPSPSSPALQQWLKLTWSKDFQKDMRAHFLDINLFDLQMMANGCDMSLHVHGRSCFIACCAIEYVANKCQRSGGAVRIKLCSHQPAAVCMFCPGAGT